MSMVTPILQTVKSFDKDNGATFSFSVSGGNQVVKNKLTIRNNTSNAVVYEETQETFNFEHIVSQTNSLVNGTTYNAYINTYDVNNNESDNSNTIQFICYTQPTLTLSNKPVEDIVDTSNYTFNVIYAQVEGELLDSIVFKLYDVQNNLIYTSDKQYNSSIPPITLSQLITGFSDLTTYKLQVIGSTLNGTYMETELYEFYVQYTSTVLFNLLELENDCDNGYIKLSSNVVSVNGTTIPENPTYINDEIYVRDIGELVAWTDGYYVDNTITTIGIYMTPANLGTFCQLINDDENNYVFKLCREVPYGQNEIKDYFEIIGTQAGEVDFYSFSNYVDPLNNLSKILVWFKKNNNNYELTLTVLERTPNVIEWNGGSNVEYNYLTDLYYEDETDTASAQKTTVNNNMNITPITNVTIENGIYDYLYITEDDLTYTTEKLSKEDWNTNTKMIVDFEGNTLGGNVNFIITQLSGIKIKRRLENTYNWTEIYSKTISSSDDLNFSIIDSFLPTNQDDEYEYAIVPILSDGTESSYITQNIKSIFYDSFISDIDSSFKLKSNVGITRNRVFERSTIQPINSRVPFIISNSVTNYESGTFSGNLIGDFSDTRVLNRKSVIDNTNNFIDFLTNGNTKIIKDWNGNICLCDIVGNISYDNNLVTGITSISFQYYEQGKYDNTEDLQNFNLIKGD